MKQSRGFTLIELMVVVVVIAILAAVALPSYLSQVRKSRRNEAQSSIQQIALHEERYRADNPGYLASATSTWVQLGGDPSGTYYDYTVAVTAAVTTSSGSTPATYTITAQGKSSQLKDYDRSSASNCSQLTYGVGTDGVISKTPSGCWQK